MTRPVTALDSTRTPLPSRGPRAGTSRAPGTARRTVAPPPTAGLAKAVAAAVGHLPDVERSNTRSAHVERTRIETLLRDAIERHRLLGAPDAAVPAVRVACAHLAAGDLEDAYLALLTARDLLR